MLRQSASASLRSIRLVPRLSPASVFTQTQAPTWQQQPLNYSYLRPQTFASAPAARRLYSATAQSEAKDGDAKPAAGEAKDAPATGERDDAKSKAPEAESPDATIKKALEAKEAEVREWKDAAMRSKAEFLNLQSRSARDQKAAREFAIQSFAKDLLENIDNLDRALSAVPQAKLDAAKASGDEASEDLKELVSLCEGLRLTESGLMQTLSRHGLVRFDPLNEKFNPNEHEATFMTPQPDKEDGIVFHVQQKGFKLNGRVVRAAKVGVVKNK